MSDEYFEEEREWSERKHELVTKYLDGFVRILGPSKRGLYYVDGFAGLGLYKDGNKGSPVHAAEFACSPLGLRYQLRCINVERDQVHFENLVINTASYSTVTANIPGAFGDKIDQILSQIGQSDAIFFVDPFGIKGIEWQHLVKVLQRQAKTELLIRINPTDLQRLAGSINSDEPGARSKVQLLTDLFGDPNELAWSAEYKARGAQGLVSLYMQRLLAAFSKPGTTGSFVSRYSIRSIDGDLKYHLVFATRHPKGAILMSDTVFNREQDYQQDVKDYKASQPQQMSLFGSSEPTEEEIFADRVNQLKEDIWAAFRGKTANRDAIRAALLQKWFGRVSSRHFTQAIKDMQQDGRVRSIDGSPGAPDAVIYFANYSR